MNAPSQRLLLAALSSSVLFFSSTDYSKAALETAQSYLLAQTSESQQTTAQADATGIQTLQKSLQKVARDSGREDAWSFVEQGDAYVQQEEYSNAIYSYNKALEISQNVALDKLNQRGTSWLRFLPVRIFFIQIGPGVQETESFVIDNTDLSLEENLYEVGATYFQLAAFSQDSNFVEQAEVALEKSRALVNKVASSIGVFTVDLEEGFREDNVPIILRNDSVERSAATLRSNSLGLESKVFNLLQQVYIAQSKLAPTDRDKQDKELQALLQAEAGRTIEVDKNIAFNLFRLQNTDEREGRLRNAVKNLSRKLDRNDIETLKKFAVENDTTFISYSIVEPPIIGAYSSDNNSTESTEEDLSQTLYIWVIQPTGEIHFRSVDLSKSLDSIVEECEDEDEDCRGGQSRIIARVPVINEVCEGDIEDCRGGQSKLVARIRGTRDALGTSRRNEDSISQTSAQTQKYLQNLYDILIEPLEGEDEENLLPEAESNIVFVPQGSIFFVPFPALIDRSDNYLIDKYTIRIATNFRTLLLDEQDSNSQSQNGEDKYLSSKFDALIIGDPAIPARTNSDIDEISEIDKITETLLPLPGAQTEARRIARLFDSNFLLTGNLASENLVSHLMPQAKNIHFATHGILNVPDYPANSETDSIDDSLLSIASGTLVLSSPLRSPSFSGYLQGRESYYQEENEPYYIPTYDSISSYDGLLTATEILRLNLDRTELVVLSSCNTGRGPLTAGGVIGLPFAFGLAGVPNTIVSQWSVVDDSTEQLMTEFYTSLLEDPNRDEAQALRQAIRSVKNTPRYSDPVHWAAFALYTGQLSRNDD